MNYSSTHNTDILIRTELIESMMNSGSLKISPHNPVQWASGARMPLYNDNRVLMRNKLHRSVVIRALIQEANTPLYASSHAELPQWDIVAGTASAGIAPAVLLAEALGIDFLYVRSNAKDHGLMRLIEGISPVEWEISETPLKDKNVLLVEDLLSTGKSALQAREVLLHAGASVPRCISIFSYEFHIMAESVATLSPPCEVRSCLGLSYLLEYAEQSSLLHSNEINSIKQWMQNPFEWMNTHAIL